MIKIQFIEGKYAPIIVCDICGQHIKDAEDAVAVNTSPSDNNEVLDVLHVHRGDCHNSADQKLGGVAGYSDMDFHLFNLIHNSGLSLDKLRERSNNYEQLS